MAKSQEYIFFDHIIGNYVESYLQFAKRMGYPITQEDGIIIWGWTRENVPSDIYFLPGKLPSGMPFNNFVRERLSDRKNLFYEVIFAPIRHNMPDLEEKMQSLSFIPATFDKVNRDIKISYGRIIYNKIFINSDFPSNPNVFDVSITMEGTSYPLNVKQEPDEHGFPMLFEKIDF